MKKLIILIGLLLSNYTFSSYTTIVAAVCSTSDPMDKFFYQIWKDSNSIHVTCKHSFIEGLSCGEASKRSNNYSWEQYLPPKYYSKRTLNTRTLELKTKLILDGQHIPIDSSAYNCVSKNSGEELWKEHEKIFNLNLKAKVESENQTLEGIREKEEEIIKTLIGNKTRYIFNDTSYEVLNSKDFNLSSFQLQEDSPKDQVLVLVQGKIRPIPPKNSALAKEKKTVCLTNSYHRHSYPKHEHPHVIKEEDISITTERDGMAVLRGRAGNTTILGYVEEHKDEISCNRYEIALKPLAVSREVPLLVLLADFNDLTLTSFKETKVEKKTLPILDKDNIKAVSPCVSGPAGCGLENHQQALNKLAVDQEKEVYEWSSFINKEKLNLSQTFESLIESGSTVNFSNPSSLQLELEQQYISFKEGSSTKDLKTEKEIEVSIATDPEDAIVVLLNDTDLDNAIGTAFYISDNLLLTNQHVIKFNNSLPFKNNKGKFYRARVLATDVRSDLALLEIETKKVTRATDIESEFQEKLNQIIFKEGDSTKDLKTKIRVKENAYLKLEPNCKIEKGDSVTTIGHPLGLEYSMTKGIISSIRTIQNPFKSFVGEVTYLQIDADLNQGNSGGPLINDSGYVVGVNTWGVTTAGGVNFSIHCSEVKKFLDSYER